MFNVKIKKSSLIVSNKEPLAAGASKVYYVSFDFDDEWNSLLKNVVFKAGDISKAVLLEGDSCAIPWEVLSSENIGEKLWVGVYGSDTEGTKLPTVWNELEVIQAGAELCESGSEPTPTAVSLIFEAAKNAESMAKNAVEEAALARNHADRAEEAKEAAESAVDVVNVIAQEAERARDEARSAIGDASIYARMAFDEAEKAAESARNAAQNAVDVKKNCANALRGQLFGASVSADDVSPLPHELDVKVKSKNIFPNSYTNKGTVTSNSGGIEITYNSDGSIVCNGTVSESGLFHTAIALNGSVVTEREAVFSTNAGGNAPSGTKILIEVIRPDGVTSHSSNGTKLQKGTSITRVYIAGNAGAVYDNYIFKPQLEYGTVPTEFTPPSIDVEGVNVTVTDGENTQTATADADGNVTGLMSLSPNMTLTTDNVGAVIECGYNKDTNKVIENLTNAIISLGGNI